MIFFAWIFVNQKIEMVLIHKIECSEIKNRNSYINVRRHRHQSRQFQQQQ
jgi:hypothetical protein